MQEISYKTQPALKILHVSDFFFSLKQNAPSQLSVGGKISQGLIRNGHHVIDFPYRDVARGGSFFKTRLLGKRHLWRVLKEFLASFCPDLLILGHGYMIPPEIIQEIREQQKGMRIIQWNIDALFVEENARDFKARHPLMDMSFISTAGPIVREIIGPYGRVGFLPNPVDRSVENGRAFEQRHNQADLFYSCGNPRRLREICGKKWDMEEFCQFLEEHLPSSCQFAYAGLRGAPYLRGRLYNDLLAKSSMGLNISRRADHYLYSSDRITHMVGNGQLILMERQTGYERFFSSEEMGFFETLEELFSLIKFYHLNPEKRQKVAHAGWERYHHLFNEAAIAHYLIEESFTEMRSTHGGEHPWCQLIEAA